MTRTCFVIAPLHGRDSAARSRTDSLIRNVLVPALGPMNFDTFHADHVDLPGQVLRQVMELAVTADLVVADLTDANPNVFLELGVRLATGKPVIQVSHDISRLPFDVAGARTIPIDSTSEAGVRRAIREVRQHAEYLISGPSLVLNPVTELFETLFTPRDTAIGPTIFNQVRSVRQVPANVMPASNDDEARVIRDTPSVVRPAWTLEMSDSYEESLLRLADDRTTFQLAEHMLASASRDPYRGDQVNLDGEIVRTLHSHIPSGLSGLEWLTLVYALRVRDRVITPLVAFIQNDEPLPDDEASTTPNASLIRTQLSMFSRIHSH